MENPTVPSMADPPKRIEARWAGSRPSKDPSHALRENGDSSRDGEHHEVEDDHGHSDALSSAVGRAVASPPFDQLTRHMP